MKLECFFFFFFFFSTNTPFFNSQGAGTHTAFAGTSNTEKGSFILVRLLNKDNDEACLFVSRFCSYIVSYVIVFLVAVPPTHRNQHHFSGKGIKYLLMCFKWVKEVY